jgi:hypothetical protein
MAPCALVQGACAEYPRVLQSISSKLRESQNGGQKTKKDSGFQVRKWHNVQGACAEYPRGLQSINLKREIVQEEEMLVSLLQI